MRNLPGRMRNLPKKILPKIAKELTKMAKYAKIAQERSTITKI